jgi:oligopeptide/dipeptide ABC transporter ATP-binding protein
LLIADEPSTALDVTIQAQILDLIEKLRTELNMAVLLITHDLGVIAEVADRVLLMYAGRIVESSAKNPFFQNPRHPYALGLLDSIPRFSYEEGFEDKNNPLSTIRGSVPDLRNLPSGCRFSDRCDYGTPQCKMQEPLMESVEPTHEVSCWEWQNL